jgi:hypothetical protein
LDIIGESWKIGYHAILGHYNWLGRYSWNKKSSNYLGLIQLAISLLWYRRAVQLAPLTIQYDVLR